MQRMRQLCTYLTEAEWAALGEVLRASPCQNRSELFRSALWALADDLGVDWPVQPRTARGRLAGYRHGPETLAKMRAAALRRQRA